MLEKNIEILVEKEFFIQDVNNYILNLYEDAPDCIGAEQKRIECVDFAYNSFGILSKKEIYNQIANRLMEFFYYNS